MNTRQDNEMLPSELISTIFKKPILSLEHERDLFRRWQEDQDERAKDEIIMAHIRLAVSIAPRYKRYGLPVSDLVQEGVAGLMEAFKRFDCSKEVRFSTYASYWISATIQHYILTNWTLVRVVTTNDRKRLFFNLNRIKAEMGISPSNKLNMQETEEVSSRLNVARRDVDIIDARMAARDNSLSDLVGGVEGGSGIEIQDTLYDELAISPEDEAIRAIDQSQITNLINDALDSMDEREAYILRARRLSEDPVSLDDLSQKFNVTPERIRQIEKRAMGRLKSFIERLISPADLLHRV